MTHLHYIPVPCRRYTTKWSTRATLGLLSWCKLAFVLDTNDTLISQIILKINTRPPNLST